MKSTDKQFLSHKELCVAFNMDAQTFKRELKRIKHLVLRPYQRYYSPNQLQIIYKQFGNPFTE